MTRLNLDRVAERVSHLLQVTIKAREGPARGGLAVRIDGLDRPTGFSIELTPGLAHVYGQLKFDTLARSLFDTMLEAPPEAWEALARGAAALEIQGISLAVSINNVMADGRRPGAIESIHATGSVVVDSQNCDERAGDLVAALAGVVLALLPIDGLPDELPFAEEGRRTQRLTTHYERSRSNRAIAIIAHGSTCLVCGFNFAQSYGELGSGYVEVHHIEPVHSMSAPRVINPFEELVPLCANCHRMVHRLDPPVPPETLRQIFETHSQARPSSESQFSIADG